jgi:Polyketide cyclase / dehydrase and lipid transport
VHLVLVGRGRRSARRSLVHGAQHDPGRTWETRSQAVVADPPREFAFVVGGTFVRWGYRFTPVAEGTEVTESWEFLPAGLAMFAERYGDAAPEQVAERTRAACEGIPATLAALRRAAEAAG